MPLNIKQFGIRLSRVLEGDDPTEQGLRVRIEELGKKTDRRDWSKYRNFWPPTVISALREGKLVLFMGAGVSAGAKFPTWRELLEQRFGIPSEFLADDSLKNDNLTLGEIASRLLGREQLQFSLRSVYNNKSARPTLTHYCLAALEMPVYITTNYDSMFEKAWEEVIGRPLAVICNSSDIKKHKDSSHKIYKIHGSADRPDELLVLTRSEYRQHYRSNTGVFDEVKDIIRSCPTVFAGFSHTDPEIGRLIDDIIFRYEDDIHNKRGGESPDLYNMQFENTYVANERFAAKGMVSLSIRLSGGADVDPRTGGIAEALAELVAATDSRMDDVTSVDSVLNDLLSSLKTDLEAALEELSRPMEELVRLLSHRPIGFAGAVESILAGIDIDRALGSQGMYVLDRDGTLIARRYSGGLNERARDLKLEDLGSNFGARPYFQASKSFRRPFISDFFESVFNGNSTFAICAPIVKDDGFHGLLFSACQIGQWRTPIDAVNEVESGLGVYILDGQGLVAVPPNREFGERVSPNLKGESKAARTGYEYLALKLLSKKDRIIIRLAENIVPVEKDDDVLSLDKALDVYARIQNLSDLGWRCAIARTIKFTGQ